MLARRSQPYARQHRSGRRDGLFRSNKGMERSRIVDSPRVFHAHRLSGVGGRAPPNLVPLFAAHHMECSQLDWRSAIPLVSVEINIFLCTLDDENLSRNITYRDQFSRVSTSNTVLWLTRGDKPVVRRTDGLFDPRAVARRVHGDVTSMMVGGIAALLLQMLHPAVLAGVWDHSNFRSDMQGRLRRTARFISITFYDSRQAAE